MIVAITAARGSGYATRVLQVLRDLGAETHLITSDDVQIGLDEETDQMGSVENLAAHVHQTSNQAARISSGSFLVDGMIVAPCTASFAAAIAYGVGRSLTHRAADVTIKEGRPLALLVVSERLSPTARDNLRTLEAIRGVTVVGPITRSWGDEDVIAREAIIELLLRAVGIQREV